MGGGVIGWGCCQQYHQPTLTYKLQVHLPIPLFPILPFPLGYTLAAPHSVSVTSIAACVWIIIASSYMGRVVRPCSLQLMTSL